MSQPSIDQLSLTLSAADRRSYSTIWKHFKKITWQTGKNGTKTAKCMLCEHPIFRLTNGTTNSLWRHLEIDHRDIFKKTESEQKRKKARTEVCTSLVVSSDVELVDHHDHIELASDR
jgi:hypothetical protein